MEGELTINGPARPGLHPPRPQRLHLVLHQRDQWRDDKADALEQDAWQLVAQGLATAGWELLGELEVGRVRGRWLAQQGRQTITQTHASRVQTHQHQARAALEHVLHHLHLRGPERPQAKHLPQRLVHLGLECRVRCGC